MDSSPELIKSYGLVCVTLCAKPADSDMEQVESVAEWVMTTLKNRYGGLVPDQLPIQILSSDQPNIYKVHIRGEASFLALVLLAPELQKDFCFH